ncbi:MAG TPA: DNA polymerase domain-containing protein, partial [Thermomicrobiaceae bacterium]|nr:DNA polymerase domain-containing protein [Thermomicrobiaceae bacterium]
MTTWTAPSELSVLYGADPTVRIVAVERVGQDRVRVFRRLPDDRVAAVDDPLQPWVVVGDSGVSALGGFGASMTTLRGPHPLRHLALFDTWNRYLDAVARLRTGDAPIHTFGHPVDQYLTLSGRTLFKGMEFDDALRLQLDIETAGINPQVPDAAVLLVALSSNRGHREVIGGDGQTEAEILAALSDRVRAIDPDVIEGHNLFNFDLPFLVERARRHDVLLGMGRDGSPPRVGGTQRFKAGARVIPYQGVGIFGRHVVDTYQQIQRYDAGGELRSYGLKEAIDELGFGRPERVFVAGDRISETFRDDPQRVAAYALDDVADVALLAELAAPTDFYQSQILPRAYQNVATGGPGEKINFLMTRAYLAERHSLPLPEVPRPYPGGYTELCHVGVFRPVVKCDVESLYPAIMLTERIAPRSDALGVYLLLLRELTARRLAAKHRTRAATGRERARLQGLQLSFKVLINSFYGYLGYNRALFSDYRAATRVTIRGQEIIRQVVGELERTGAEAIEVDTDGVYFRPPESVSGLEAEETYVNRIAGTLPEGIDLSLDGSFAGMISLKTKNYALMTPDGHVVLKGSSLRSRREERVFRRFLDEAARRFILADHDRVRDLYLDVAQQILEHALPPSAIARWESITEKTYTSEANRRVAAAAEGARIGERLLVYRRGDGSLCRIEEYAGDEDVEYLLRRLRDMAERFRPLVPDEAAFNYRFPRLGARSDIAAQRA